MERIRLDDGKGVELKTCLIADKTRSSRRIVGLAMHIELMIGGHCGRVF
jgi:hypothetical protein